MDIKDRRKAFVAWTNSDLTEGRGRRLPKCVCKLESTAKRMGEREGVQGSSCPVEEVDVFWYKNMWYGPIDLHAPTREDEINNIKDRLRKEALQKARDAGLTEEDIKALL